MWVFYAGNHIIRQKTIAPLLQLKLLKTVCQIVGYCLPYETAKEKERKTPSLFIILSTCINMTNRFMTSHAVRWVRDEGEEAGRKATTDTVMLIPKVGTLARHTHT